MPERAVETDKATSLAKRLTSRLIGLAQKANDFTDYVRHRSRMKRQVRSDRRKLRRVLGRHVDSLLVVRLASIGDVARASGVVRALRTRYPGARIDFLATEATLPVIRHNPALNAVYTLKDLSRLPAYDWIINLQNLVPPDSFLRGSNLSYGQILEHLSSRERGRLVTGRHLEHGSETTLTNILYCVSEIEEHFLTALMPYDPARYPRTEIHVDERVRAAVREKFPMPGDRPVLAIFLGSNSVGCGADEGFRTYSMNYLEQLIRHFDDRFAIAVIGQSQVRNPSERAQYRDILGRYPRVIDLVDRTSLDELVCLMDSFSLLISCDSSPVHIAMGRGVPVIGLYVNDGTFRMHQTLGDERFVAINSMPPCFKYSWRWKFFCSTCRDPATRSHYCYNEAFVFGVDRIPLAQLDRAAAQLLGGGSNAGFDSCVV